MAATPDDGHRHFADVRKGPRKYDRKKSGINYRTVIPGSETGTNSAYFSDSEIRGLETVAFKTTSILYMKSLSLKNELTGKLGSDNILQHLFSDY